MRLASRDNYYFLLARILSPWKSDNDISVIRKLIKDDGTILDWLLILANQHLCSPQLFFELQQHGLLSLLPGEMSEYLETIVHLNRKRNETLQAELEQVLDRFQQQGIESILLKGGASFVDRLYADIGARIMHDIDLLVHPARLEEARQIMLGLGYLESDMPGMAKENLPTDARHCHLPAFYKPGTQSIVEIHFDVGYGQAGLVFDREVVWGKKVRGAVSNQTVFIFDPAVRVMHNVVHALLPECEFIRSQVSLRQLLEFVLLVQRYGKEIDWSACLHLCEQKGLGTEFLAYVQTASLAFAMRVPEGVTCSNRAMAHARRIIAGGNCFSVSSMVPLQRIDTLRLKMAKLFCGLYYWVNLPFWIWNNVCFAEEGGAILLRLRYLLKKMQSAESRARAKFW